jgi:hypothetical protein
VSDNSRAIAAAVLGAVGGAVVGYLLFTDRGRALRRELESAIEGTTAEFNSLRSAVQKTADLATEGWKLLNDAVGEVSAEPPRFDRARQTAPF